jgi:translation elongation factor EF-Tu-like GTPase
VSVQQTARIVDFLNKVVEDAAFNERFEQEPKQTMSDFGLTAEQGLIILGGTLEELRDAVRDEVGQEVMVIMARMAP